MKIRFKKTEDPKEKIEIWVYNVYNLSLISYKTKDSPLTIPVISDCQETRLGLSGTIIYCIVGSGLFTKRKTKRKEKEIRNQTG